MRQFTIYGYENFRFYCSNPYGHCLWFETREARDAVRLTAQRAAAVAGLTDPPEPFRRVSRKIRTKAQRDWLAAIMSGHRDTPRDAMSHSFYVG
jgi:hypothetical protein